MSRARTIQATIRRYLDTPSSGLTRVPETEDRSIEDAIRLLQVQIFELSDAITDLAEELDKHRRR